MKKILVPTDFSHCAIAAGDLAVDLAVRLQAEVHFYTRIHVHPLWDQLPDRTATDFPESFARISETKKRFSQLRKRYRSRSPQLITSYSHGHLIRVLSRYIDQEHIDLIVMGSHGQHSVGDFLFGSNAQKIVKHAPCPVMVVKQPAEPTQWQHIVFASDFRPEAKQSFAQLLALIAPFDAHLHLVPLAAPASFNQTQEGEQDDEAIEEFTRMCWRHPWTIHELGAAGLATGIQALVQACQADLVAVAHYGQPSLKRIFTCGVTEALINQLEVPVMVLNPGESDSWHQMIKLTADE